VPGLTRNDVILRPVPERRRDPEDLSLPVSRSVAPLVANGTTVI